MSLYLNKLFCTEEVRGTLEDFYCQHTVSVYFYTLDLQQLILGSLPFRFAVYTLQCVRVRVCVLQYGYSIPEHQ